MVRYAARGVGWSLVLAAALTTVGLMLLVAAWPSVTWPLQGTAIGVLAGAAAWSMDEVSGAVVDTLPRSLRWRTAARASGLLALAAVWCACVLLAGDRLPPHSALFVLQGVAALITGAAVATWWRARGHWAPGTAIASAAIPCAAAAALLRPVPDQLPVFPVWAWEAWTLSAVIWTAVLAAGALLLVRALTPR